MTDAALQPEPNPYQPPQRLRAPEGTRTGTVWIWLAAFVPLLSSLSIFLIDFDAMLQTVVARSTDASTAFAFFTPGYIVFIVGNWLLTVAGVVFAVLDYRTLTARGVPRPFHWAFSVFVLAGYGIVYPIGRGVIVQLRTGRGMAPTVAAILVYSAGFVIGLVWTVMLVTQILTVIPYLPPVPVS